MKAADLIAFTDVSFKSAVVEDTVFAVLLLEIYRCAAGAAAASSHEEGAARTIAHDLTVRREHLLGVLSGDLVPQPVATDRRCLFETARGSVRQSDLLGGTLDPTVRAKLLEYFRLCLSK